MLTIYLLHEPSILTVNSNLSVLKGGIVQIVSISASLAPCHLITSDSYSLCLVLSVCACHWKRINLWMEQLLWDVNGGK